jgi:hypothetical protein
MMCPHEWARLDHLRFSLTLCPLPQGRGPVSNAMRVLGGLARWRAT